MKIKRIAMAIGVCFFATLVMPTSFAESTGLVTTVYAESNNITLNNPVIVSDTSMRSKKLTTWDCVYFGNYPQVEVVSEEDIAQIEMLEGLNEEYVTEYRLVNATEWNDIVNASYDSKGDAIVNGAKYRRIKKEEASSYNSTYQWIDATSYHYFKYEPIKWRVLEVKDDSSEVCLIADMALDAQPYDVNHGVTSWGECTLRSWLNGYDDSKNLAEVSYENQNFVDDAFSKKEQESIVTGAIELGQKFGDRYIEKYYNDKIYLLSADETIYEDYGFHGLTSCDEASRCEVSTYAKARGVRIPSSLSDCSQNCMGHSYWWLRAPSVYYYEYGSRDNNGSLYKNGYSTSDKTFGVRPMLKLDISTSNCYSYAGTVSSNEEISESEWYDVTSVILDKQNLSIEAGEKEQLVATVQPANASNSLVNWQSSDDTIIQVSETGEVVAIRAGKAVVTAQSGYCLASCEIIVTQEMTSLNLNKESIDLYIGEKERLEAVYEPEDATNTDFCWTSSDDSIINVSPSGEVTAVSVGQAIVTVSGGGFSASCKVTSSELAVSGIVLDTYTKGLKIGDKYQITANIQPINATNTTILWESSDSKVATVDNNGTVTGISEGKCEIIASSINGKSGVCNVNVSASDVIDNSLDWGGLGDITGKKQFVLTADISTSDVLEINSLADITIDLNGHIIEGAEKVIDNNGKLSIMDSSEDKTGKIVMSSTSTMLSGSCIENNGNLNIEGGMIVVETACDSNIYTGDIAVINNNGNLLFKGGNIVVNSQQTTVNSFNRGWGILNNPNGSLDISGGKIDMITISKALSGNRISSYIYGIYNNSTNDIQINGLEINCCHSCTVSSEYNAVICSGIWNQFSGDVNISNTKINVLLDGVSGTITGGVSGIHNQGNGNINFNTSILNVKSAVPKDILVTGIENDSFGNVTVGANNLSTKENTRIATLSSTMIDSAINNNESGILSIQRGTIYGRVAICNLSKDGDILLGINDGRVGENELNLLAEDRLVATSNTHIYIYDGKYKGTFGTGYSIVLPDGYCFTNYNNNIANNSIAEKHSWDTGKVTKNPTTTEEGTKIFTCNRCKVTMTKNIAVKEKTSISNAKVILSTASYNYDGKNKKPSVKSVVLNGKELVANIDYSVSYTNNGKNKNVGSYTVKITGKGVYKDTVDATYKIKVSKGKTYTVSGQKYKVTNASTNGNGTVTLTGTTTKKSKLTKLTIGNTVAIGGKSYKITAIGDKSFKGYTKLKTIKIGNNVTTIGKETFFGCTAVTSATIGNSVTTISDKAFYNCKKLTKITIPSKVAKIGKQTFGSCKKLKSITIKSTKLKSVGSKAITGINKSATIKVPKKKYKSYKKLFKSSTGFKNTMKIKK